MNRLWLLFLLAACAPHTPVFAPVDVDLPLAVPCRAALVAKPAFALGEISAKDNVAEKVRAALVEIQQRRAYEMELEAQNAACR